MEAERMSRPSGSSRACASAITNVNSSCFMVDSIFIQTTIIAQIMHGMQDWYSRVYLAVSLCLPHRLKFSLSLKRPEPEFFTFKEPKNRFYGTNSASLWAGTTTVWPLPTLFKVPIDCLKVHKHEII